MGTYYGTNFNDVIYGSVDGDVMYGYDGNDSLFGFEGNDVLYGYAGNDYLYGYAGNDYLYGHAGDDYLWGGADNDFLQGGDGADILSGGTGIDTVDYNGAAGVYVNLATGYGYYGEAAGDRLYDIENVQGTGGYGDTLIGSAVANVLSGYGGNDYLYGNDGNDTLYGMGDNDFLQGGNGADWLDGGAGIDTADYNGAAGVYVNLATGYGYYGEAAGDRLFNVENVQGTGGYGDTLIGSAVANVLSGYGGNDYLYGNDGNDTLYGMGDNDFLQGGNGADWLDGGAGIDTADYNGTAGVYVNLATGYGYYGEAAGDRLFGIENVQGTGGYGDTLIGSAVANVLSGYGGNDYLSGGAGADTLNGGSGIDAADYYGSTAGVYVSLATGYGYYGDAAGDRLYDIETVYGSASYGDTLIGSAVANVLSGYGGNDFLQGGAGADTLYGGAGIDTADYNGAAGVYVNLATGYGYYGEAAGDRLYDIENVQGTGGYGDTLVGSAVANVLSGYGGNDYLYGNDGNDTLYGMDGNDFLQGGNGADWLDGGAGIDTVDYNGAAGVYVNLSTGYGYYGEAAGDRLFNVENVQGTSGYGDTLIGSAVANVLSGYGGNDALYGYAGNDTLYGMSDNDYLSGGDGNDILSGGAGRDTLAGGGGADRFVFSAPSESAVATPDRILDFSHAQADRIDLSAIDANTGVAGNQAFTFGGAGAGALTYAFSGTDTVISGHVNGDGIADFRIVLSGHIALVAADFVL
ncbi:calcium-binding protein [Inquilinus sp. Marseille-Q2685]|uniref:calcium-binding protein n=1 Tax=Inquilinus sp. Marseille-Q2685 TaxID=2866581 RepID=UPI001CE4A6A7|nr:calcium-binding protein [Inquilinus sp. Marseille-Q2685]